MQSKPSISTDLAAAIGAHYHFVMGRPGGIRADLRFIKARGIDLRHLRLDDIELSGADLAGANLSGANLTRASLYCTDISGADLSESKLCRADLRGARLHGANFEFSDMDGADFRQSTIAVVEENGKWRVIGNSATASVSFANCSLKKARLNNANLKNAKFDGALLNGASFAGASLENASFEGAVLVGVRLSELRVPPEKLKNCITDPDPHFRLRLPEFLAMLDGAEKWARSNGQLGKQASFEGQDIRLLAQHMKGRVLTGIDLRKTIAVNTDFTGCELQAARFDGADLRGATFAHADLRGASFRDANIAHVDFTGANLKPLALESGAKMPTVFDGAAVDRAKFSEASR
jgi:uncharacterized protein YjbI with pentapeptide repeats